MPFIAPDHFRTRVLIATTAGPVEVDRIRITASTLVATVKASQKQVTALEHTYEPFVQRGTGVVADTVGHDAFRLELSDDIATGESWKLGVFIAHALKRNERLAEIGDEADCVVLATGVVDYDLRVSRIDYLPDKIERSRSRLSEERAKGVPVLVVWPKANGEDVDPTRRDMLKDLGIEAYEIAEVNDILGVFNSRLARLASASSGAPRWSGSPYKGLEPFGTADSPVFFGRGPERQEAMARLRQAAAQGTAFLLLHGSSGVGKSSLARAGLLADIRTLTSDADHWRTEVLAKVQPGRSPLQTLVDALVALRVDKGAAADPDRLVDLARDNLAEAVSSVLAELGAGDAKAVTKTALVVDQLEDCLSWPAEQKSAAAKADSATFAGMIERLARSGAVWIIATLRSDLLPLLESSPPLMRLATDERLFRVKSPSRFALRDMVARPAAEAGLTFKGHNSAGVSLEDILVDDAAHLADSLPLLQFALSRLYEQRDRKSGALTVEDYARFGSLEGAIGRYAEEQTVEAFGHAPEMTRAVEDIIVALARFDRESGAAVGRTATFEVHDSSPKGHAIAALAKARLVTLDEAAGKQVVRLAHDTLLSHWDRARQVLSKRKGMVVFRARLDDMVDNWKKTRDPAYLLKGLDLEAANALVKEEPAWVSTDLAALVHGSSLALDAEKDELKRRARRERLRWQVASAGSGVLLALLAGLYWYSQKATRAELEATRNLELASQAVQTLATKGFERFVTLSLPSDYGRELLATARDLEEKIASKDAASPPVRFQQAVLLGVTSSYANALGDQPAAEQDIGKAITILAALVEQDPENVEWRRLLAKSNVALGEMLVASGNTTSREKAIAAFNDAQAIVDALLTANPIDPLPDPQDQRLRASIRKGEGDIAAQEWQDAPESADAERASLGKDMIHNYTSMYNILKDYIASDADKLALSEADRTVATAYLKIGQVGEAARYAKEALLVVDQLLTGVSTPPLYQQRKAEVLLLLGRIYVEENEQPGAPAGQTGKVIDALEQARTILVDLVERDPGNDVWRHDLFDAQRRLAALLATPGNVAKARPVAQAAAETAEAIVVRHPNDIASVHDMVAAQSALGGIDLDAGDIDGAIRFLSAARDAGENGPERIPADRGIQMVLADAEGGLAQALSRASPPRFDEAKVALQSRIDLALKLLISGRESAPDVRRLATAYGDMGHLYATRDGKSGAALDYYRNAIGQFEKLVTEPSSPRADPVAYGSALLAAGDLAEARAQKADALSFYTKGIDTLRKAVAADPTNANARLALSTILATGPVASLRNGDEALALAKAVQADRPDDIRVFDALAAASARTGDFVNAVAFETKVLSDATFARATDAEQRLAAYKEGKPWPQP